VRFTSVIFGLSFAAGVLDPGPDIDHGLVDGALTLRAVQSHLGTASTRRCHQSRDIYQRAKKSNPKLNVGIRISQYQNNTTYQMMYHPQYGTAMTQGQVDAHFWKASLLVTHAKLNMWNLMVRPFAETLMPREAMILGHLVDKSIDEHVCAAMYTIRRKVVPYLHVGGTGWEADPQIRFSIIQDVILKELFDHMGDAHRSVEEACNLFVINQTVTIDVINLALPNTCLPATSSEETLQSVISIYLDGTLGFLKDCRAVRQEKFAEALSGAKRKRPEGDNDDLRDRFRMRSLQIFADVKCVMEPYQSRSPSPAPPRTPDQLEDVDWTFSDDDFSTDEGMWTLPLVEELLRFVGGGEGVE
jgi:hypothetical protein